MDLTGIKDFTPHCLRHSFASKMLMRGCQLPDLRELLGHADIKTTLRYAHLSPNYMKNTISLLDDE